MRRPYPTDLTDREWELVKELIPEPIHVQNLQKPVYSRRDVLDAIFYRARTGCPWRNLPHDFPPWKRVYEYFRIGRDKGSFERVHDSLRAQVRQRTP